MYFDYIYKGTFIHSVNVNDSSTTIVIMNDLICQAFDHAFSSFFFKCRDAQSGGRGGE
jgi:hypothetical protein